MKDPRRRGRRAPTRTHASVPAHAALVAASLLTMLAMAVPDAVAAPGDHPTGVACTTTDALGAPACNAPADPAAAPRTRGARHVGNPIEIATGNKYEGTTDFRSIASPLAFMRHYNSAAADVDLGLGYGWRHGFSTSLARVDERRLLVTQGDGRTLAFDFDPAAPSGSKGPWFSVDGTSGRIEHDGPRYRWHLPDGRVLSFAGTWLVGVAYPNGERLTLGYDGRRLVRIEDEHGTALELRWAPGERGLPTWGADPDLALDDVPAGHLEALLLPDGSRMLYRYSGALTLVGVEHHGGKRSEPVARYGYADPDHGRALTSVTRHRDGPIDEAGAARRVETRRWRYDADGLAVAELDANGKARFTIERLPAAVDGAGVDGSGANPTGDGSAGGRAGSALVRHRDGSVRRHEWASADGADERRRDGRIEYGRAGGASEGGVGVPDDAHFEIGTAGGTVVESDEDAEGAERRRETQALLDALQPVPGALDATLPPSVTGASAALHFRAGRDGRVLEVRVGDAPLEPLQRRARRNAAVRCEAATADAGAPRPSPAERIDRLASGAAPCIEDLVWLETLRGDTARYAHDGRLQRRSKLFGGDPYCELPGTMDCAQMRDVLAMAMLSDCVYDRTPPSPCAPGWNRVDPASIGLQPHHFSIDDFHAELFQEGTTGRFVLVYRGTDELADLPDSVGQFVGITAGQYSRAGELARQVRDRLALHHPGSTLAFSGHSMGGGLATFAAMHERDPATVFNPSAVRPVTSILNRFTWFETDNHVEVVRVRGEILSVLQTGMAAPGRHTPISRPHDVRFWETVDAHYMSSVLASLRTYLAKHCP